MSDSENNLRATPLLDYNAPGISQLIADRKWKSLSEHERIGAAYDFVRTEILFGYNAKDAIPASRVLQDGYGQCNTKATLLMALFRALGIPCRLHGFTIHKSLQRGIVPELAYAIAPENILHSWVEIQHNGKWINLEGFIVDDAVLAALQARFKDRGDSLCGYGVGTNCLTAPAVGWTGASTYIQRTGINQDLGLFDDPDSFYKDHRQRLGLVREFLYRHIVRHWMNARVRGIRRGAVPAIPGGPDASPPDVLNDDRASAA